MKVQHFKDESKIKIEDLDDLWYLRSVLSKGDEISGVSYRRLKDETKARADKGQRVRVFLGVRYEDAEFHPHSKSLRITGPLTHSGDPNVTLGSYHTLEVSVGETVKVKKNWKIWQLDRLSEAVKSSKEGLILIVSVEEGEADFAVLRRYGIDYSFRLTQTIAGKEMEEKYTASVTDFIDAVAKKIESLKRQEEIASAIVCGPGFAKEKILNNLRNRGVKDVFLESAGCGGRAGIQEVLKKGVVEKIVKENRVASETRLVEELFSRIAKNGLSSYGTEEVQRAVDLGAVETLLLTYTFLQKHNPDRLIESVKKRRGDILVVSPEHDAGERLNAVGGVAALLRFPIS
jgi:protein pelota